MQDAWWNLPLEDLTQQQWEALCDGCGKCCMAKLQDIDTEEIYYTNVACKLFDEQTCRCKDYSNRMTRVPDCISLSLDQSHTFAWLPDTCAYKLRFNSQPLFDWHPLITEDANSIHRQGVSMRSKTVSQQEAGPLEHHIIDI